MKSEAGTVVRVRAETDFHARTLTEHFSRETGRKVHMTEAYAVAVRYALAEALAGRLKLDTHRSASRDAADAGASRGRP